jgi:methylglyoxal synthase
VALIAHDEKKDDLLDLVTTHLEVFAGVHLVATGTTGSLIREHLGLPVELKASGPEGGDLQIGAAIAGGEVHAVIFLRDPLTAHPHEPDIQALLKVCDVHDVPFATNRASAEILVMHLKATGKPVRLVHPSLGPS